MSDDEEGELVYVKKLKTIHYGSLEESERAKLLKNEISPSIDLKTDLGQVHLSTEYFDLEHEMYVCGLSFSQQLILIFFKHLNL